MRTGPRSRQQPASGKPHRDRRGRGVRGGLAPREVPLHRSRSEAFDDLVIDAVEELEEHWAAELAGVEFAVEEVPPVNQGRSSDFDPDVVVDRGIPLGQLYRSGVEGVAGPVVVVYRRPVEARAVDAEDRADLVFMVVAELMAELLGRDIDEVDPG
ncbi:MAG: uncharacterized protein JWO57_1734 [Pseudonocardiales bacterium]|nr:uncharacterized protein [Pseudonocardiales bacterium]